MHITLTSVRKVGLVGAAVLALVMSAQSAQAQSATRTQANALKRCELHRTDVAVAACEARVKGGAGVQVSGSVRGGGLFRANVADGYAVHAIGAGPVVGVWNKRSDVVNFVRVDGVAAEAAPAPVVTRDPATWHN